MNRDEQYMVNRGNTEHPAWEAAHWESAAEITGFHHMRLDGRLDGDAPVVIKHISAIKPVKANTKPLEDEISRLLEHKGLTPEARKLITAALQAQATGASSNFTI